MKCLTFCILDVTSSNLYRDIGKVNDFFAIFLSPSKQVTVTCWLKQAKFNSFVIHSNKFLSVKLAQLNSAAVSERYLKPTVNLGIPTSTLVKTRAVPSCGFPYNTQSAKLHSLADEVYHCTRKKTNKECLEWRVRNEPLLLPADVWCKKHFFMYQNKRTVLTLLTAWERAACLGIR
jgi:hypothetical protein